MKVANPRVLCAGFTKSLKQRGIYKKNYLLLRRVLINKTYVQKKMVIRVKLHIAHLLAELFEEIYICVNICLPCWNGRRKIKYFLIEDRTYLSCVAIAIAHPARASQEFGWLSSPGIYSAVPTPNGLIIEKYLSENTIPNYWEEEIRNNYMPNKMTDNNI